MNMFLTSHAVVLATALASAGVSMAETSSTDTPVGEVGLGATYQLAGDPANRPEYERTNKLTVVEFGLTAGPTAERDGQTYQWIELTFARSNGERYRLWMLVDHLPGPSGHPAVARYVWSEPQWQTPLEYVNRKTGLALLPRIPTWSYGWPQGLPDSLTNAERFPQQVHFQGYPFKLTKTSRGVDVAVPKAKVLQLNPDLIIFTINSFRYLGPARWHLPQGEAPYSKDKYRRLTANDVREMMAVGFNLFNDGHRSRKVLDLWREPVFVLDTARPWPQLLYRSNYHSYRWHINEPASRRSSIFNDKPDVIATWSPKDLAQNLESHIESLMTTWLGFGLWRRLESKHGLGNLDRYQEPICSWDNDAGTAWYQMAGQAGGFVKEKGGLASNLRLLNMVYGCEIPNTQANAFGLGTAVLRGAARSHNKVWGVSVYGSVDMATQLAGLEYAYRRGATHFWFWSGWPDIDLDWPHFYKLFMVDQLQNIAKRHGPRDMQALLRAAKVAVVLPYGYTMGSDGTMLDTSWMHTERTNTHGLKIRQVLHNAYVEAEGLLRAGIEFDVVVDRRFDAEGYEQLIYILEDAKVRVERHGKVELLDGPRVPVRPYFGPRPRISAELARRPRFVGDQGLITVRVENTSGDTTWRNPRPYGADRKWQCAFRRLFRPDGLLRRGRVAVESSNATKTVLSGRLTLDDLDVPGTYRLQLITIDEFSRSAETWLEFDIKAKFVDSPVSKLPGHWKFKLDREKVGEAQKWYARDRNDADWAAIKVPAWWEKAGYPDYDGVAWYRCSFHVPTLSRGKTIILAFGAVDGEALVYLNGRRVGRHDGDNEEHWDKPFDFDVSRLLQYGKANQLTVRVLATQAMGGIFKPVQLLSRRALATE